MPQFTKRYTIDAVTEPSVGSITENARGTINYPQAFFDSFVIEKTFGVFGGDGVAINDVYLIGHMLEYYIYDDGFIDSIEREYSDLTIQANVTEGEGFERSVTGLGMADTGISYVTGIWMATETEGTVFHAGGFRFDLINQSFITNTSLTLSEQDYNALKTALNDASGGLSPLDTAPDMLFVVNHPENPSEYGYVSINLTDLTHSLVTTSIEIQHWLAAFDTYVFFLGTDGGIYTIDEEQYVFEDAPFVFSAGCMMIRSYDGDDMYLWIFPSIGTVQQAIRFSLDNNFYDVINFSGPFLAGANDEGAIVGGVLD